MKEEVTNNSDLRHKNASNKSVIPFQLRIENVLQIFQLKIFVRINVDLPEALQPATNTRLGLTISF